MTKAQAILREQQLDAVIERLVLIGVRGLTLGPVLGMGRGGAHREVFRGSAYQVDFVSKVQIEWYGPDDEAEAIVLHVEEAVRIRTGERGIDAV
jgi:nitrogen regulatory protein P-II 1